MKDAWLALMTPKAWERPRFVELNLSTEVGGYYEEHDFPLFLAARKVPEKKAQKPAPRS